jgi:hypothetical protein
MAFEGVFETTCTLGFRGELVDTSDVTEGVLLGAAACEVILLTESGTALGSGGGKGDIEIQLTEAEWAW